MVFKTESFIKKSVRRLSPYKINKIPLGVGIKLDANESNYTLPPRMAREYANFLKGTLINLYPDSEYDKLVKSLEDFFKIDSGNFIFGNGSDELILTILLSLDRDVAVNIPEPSFSMYKIIAAYNDLKINSIKLKRDDFDLPPDTGRAKKGRNIFFLSCPNNPTGNYFNPGILKRLINDKNNVVVIDEAYIDFSGRETFIPYVKNNDNLIVLKTFSKIGMAGLRFGMLFAGERLLNEFKKIKLPFNVNSLTLKSIEFFLDNFSYFEKNIKRTVKERKRVYNHLARLDFLEAYPSEANFIFIRLKKASYATKFDTFLKKNGIIVRGFEGELANFFRVSIGSNSENTALTGCLELFQQNI